MRGLKPAEVTIAALFLSGETRQGKLHVSYAALHAAHAVAPAQVPALSVPDVDGAFDEIAKVKGAGANARRSELLQALMTRATVEEQAFLTRLIAGELRQGALQALVLEAVAAAAEVPVADVRKAAMSAGGLGEVAQALLREGRAALARFSITRDRAFFIRGSGACGGHTTGELTKRAAGSLFLLEYRQNVGAGSLNYAISGRPPRRVSWSTSLLDSGHRKLCRLTTGTV